MRKFTLVELIFVVAILSIQISLLLPSIRKAKNAALQDVCLANVNQLQIAYMRFTMDNDYTFPYNRKEVIGGNNLSDFQKHSKIFSYLNNNYEVFKCPADPMPHTGVTYRHAIKSYGFNAYLHEIFGWSIKKLHQVEDSHNNVMGFVDEAGNVQNGFLPNAADWVGAWHNKSYNLSFLDGSAKSVKTVMELSSSLVADLANGQSVNFRQLRNNPDHAKLVEFMDYKITSQ